MNHFAISVCSEPWSFSNLLLYCTRIPMLALTNISKLQLIADTTTYSFFRRQFQHVSHSEDQE